MLLITGLGNPGPEYANTRHNIGFMVVDRLLQQSHFSTWQGRFNGLWTDGRVGQTRVGLLKPLTFMNRSGQSVQQASAFYKIPPAQVLVVVDDTALPIGQLRLKPAGTAGGHNGLADIQRAIGTTDYPRLRIGIGQPEINGHRIAQKDYVLGKFTDEQSQTLATVLPTAVKAITCWANAGIDAAMNQFNATGKPEKDNGSAQTGPQPLTSTPLPGRSESL